MAVAVGLEQRRGLRDRRPRRARRPALPYSGKARAAVAVGDWRVYVCHTTIVVAVGVAWAHTLLGVAWAHTLPVVAWLLVGAWVVHSLLPAASAAGMEPAATGDRCKHQIGDLGLAGMEAVRTIPGAVRNLVLAAGGLVGQSSRTERAAVRRSRPGLLEGRSLDQVAGHSFGWAENPVRVEARSPDLVAALGIPGPAVAALPATALLVLRTPAVAVAALRTPAVEAALRIPVAAVVALRIPVAVVVAPLVLAGRIRRILAAVAAFHIHAAAVGLHSHLLAVAVRSPQEGVARILRHAHAEAGRDDHSSRCREDGEEGRVAGPQSTGSGCQTALWTTWVGHPVFPRADRSGTGECRPHRQNDGSLWHHPCRRVLAAAASCPQVRRDACRRIRRDHRRRLLVLHGPRRETTLDGARHRHRCPRDHSHRHEHCPRRADPVPWWSVRLRCGG